jgi:hypothetical protein
MPIRPDYAKDGNHPHGEARRPRQDENAPRRETR